MTTKPSGRLYSVVTKYWPRIAAGLVVAAAAGCGDSGPTDGGPDPLPEVTGEWELELVLAYPVGTTGGDGVCTFTPAPFRVTFAPISDDAFAGTHAALTMDCVGVTSAATQLSGVRDTTVQFPSGSLSAGIQRSCGLAGCTGPPSIGITIADLFFIGAITPQTGNARAMSGGFTWNPSQVGRVFGQWDASRR